MSLAPTPWRFERARTRVVVRDAHGDLLFIIEGGGGKWDERAADRREAALRAIEAAMAVPSATRPIRLGLLHVMQDFVKVHQPDNAQLLAQIDEEIALSDGGSAT